MKKIKLLTLLFVLTISYGSFAQTENFRFQKLLKSAPITSTAFAIKNESVVLERLLTCKEVQVKQITKNWVYVQTTPKWIADAQKSGFISQFYYEFAPPVALNDSSAVTHFVRDVQQGAGGLQMPYTGSDVIIGYVDQGLDFNHPDFLDANGDTRVLYYWDHTLPFDAARTPQPYGYGQLWYKSDMDNGICTSNEESTGHGTTVTGVGSSDGSSTGREKGMAPDSKIIFVETNFSLPNWTLTIADACDFIFKKADSLGMPAVVNLSLGSYLGSHDGDDPASELMEELLDEKGGRIIVCAAGNSGSWGKYHVHGDVDTDTSFVWMLNNPTSQLGANTIYMDLWTDLAVATWNYGFGANLPNGSFNERGETGYRLATTGAGTAIYDTIWNGSNRLATIEIYPEIVGNTLHMEIYFSKVDSTDYLYAFKTVGSGNYDGWTGSTSISLNNMQTVVPNAATYPPIVHYNMPDSLQTTVSSWNCSEKVVSVGNLRNRLTHIDQNGNLYAPAPGYTSLVGQLSINSSKGPNRHGVIRPTISASGDIALSACPSWMIANTGWNSVKSDDGMHARNGGTSMASPLVAGVAALYLQKCSNGTYQSFMNDLQSSAMTDAFTGSVPNNAYGYGKIHALNLMLESEFTATVNGISPFCSTDTFNIVSSATIVDAIWSNGDTNAFTFLNTSQDLSAIAIDEFGCKAKTDTIAVIAGDIPPTPIITLTGNIISTAPFANLQWYENGVAIPGETSNTLTIDVTSTSDFTVVATGSGGCEVTSNTINPTLGMEELMMHLSGYPNPVESDFHFISSQPIDQVIIFDLTGKIVSKQTPVNQTISTSMLVSGTYLLNWSGSFGTVCTKIIKK